MTSFGNHIMKRHDSDKVQKKCEDTKHKDSNSPDQRFEAKELRTSTVAYVPFKVWLKNKTDAF